MKTSRFALALARTLVFSLLFLPLVRGQDVVEQWVQRYDGPISSADRGTAVAVDSAGNVIVTGASYHQVYDYYTAKYAAPDGALVWEVRYSSGGDSEAVAIAVDANDNVIVTGSSRADFFSGRDIYTAQYAAADGALIWERRSTDPGSSHDNFATGLAIDGHGNVIVHSRNDRSNGEIDMRTFKYAAADGTVIWEVLNERPGYDFARGVAVDNDDNVIVTGSVVGTDFDDAFYTAKYAAADGSLLWEAIRDDGIGTAVAVDGSGNVIMTGSADSDAGDSDYYTVKYAGADGSLIWQATFDGPDHEDDYPIGLGLDAAGNVIVTGNSQGIFLKTQFYTIKYAAVDGAQLWEHHYSTQFGSIFPSALAVDASGNTFVTAYTGNGDNDVYDTVKYAAADGALLWEKLYSGPSDSLNRPAAIALTPEGGAAVTGFSRTATTAQDYTTIRYGPPDTGTLPPVLTSPAAVSTQDQTVAVDFTLAEAASAGTLKLTFSGPTMTELTLVPTMGHVGRHQFNLNAVDPGASPAVSGINGAGSLLAGIYTVTLSYQDLSGHSAASASSENVTIITPTLPPVLRAPASGTILRSSIDVSFTLPNTAVPGSVSLSFGATTLFLAGTQESAGTHAFSFDSTDPAASPEVATGGPVPDGNYTVTLSYRDVPASPAATDSATDVTVAATTAVLTTLAATESAVPGAGSNPRIPAGAVWSAFGVPAIDDDGVVTFLGKWTVPGGESRCGIFGGAPTTLLVAADDYLVGSNGRRRSFQRFQDPVAANGGVAFLATLAGPGVTPLKDKALYHFGGGVPRLVAREGQEMPGVPGSQLKAIISAAVDGDNVLLTGRLNHGPGGVTGANDTGAWRWQVNGTLTPVVREGTMLSGVSASPVKTFRLLQTVSGTAGTGRGLWRDDVATFQATFADGTSALVDADTNGATTLYASGAPTVPGAPDAKWATFGPPATPGTVDGVAFLGTLRVSPGGVTSANAKRLFFRGGSTVAIARRDAAPGLLPGARFSAFRDPVISPGSAAFAFMGTASLGAAAIPGVWWQRNGGSLEDAVAVVGATPPGLSIGVRWAQFTSMAATDFGPIFTARLGGALPASNKGLWATDSAGTLRQLLRTGDSLNGKTIASFTALTTVPNAAGVRRSFTGNGCAIVRVAFTDGHAELVKITLP